MELPACSKSDLSPPWEKLTFASYVPTLFLCATEAAHIGAAGLTHADGWNVNWLDYAPARAPPARLDDKTYVDMLVRIRKALHHELEISKREFVGGKALKLPPFKWGNCKYLVVASRLLLTGTQITSPAGRTVAPFSSALQLW